MSDEIDVHWSGQLAADGPTLHAALAALGFQATILHELREAKGFWPIEISGLRTGFEVYGFKLGEGCDDARKVMPGWDGEDKTATFRFFGNAEGGAAFAVAAALAKLGGARILDRHAGVDIWASSEEATAKAHRMIALAGQAGSSK